MEWQEVTALLAVVIALGTLGREWFKDRLQGIKVSKEAEAIHISNEHSLREQVSQLWLERSHCAEQLAEMSMRVQELEHELHKMRMREHD